MKSDQTNKNNYFDKEFDVFNKENKVLYWNQEGRKGQILFYVNQNLSNTTDTMHGGAIFTAFDSFFKFFIGSSFKIDANLIELTVKYLSPVKINSVVLFEINLVKVGKTLAFVEGKIYEVEKNYSGSTDYKFLIESIKISNMLSFATGSYHINLSTKEKEKAKF